MAGEAFQRDVGCTLIENDTYVMELPWDSRETAIAAPDIASHRAEEPKKETNSQATGTHVYDDVCFAQIQIIG